MASEYTNIPLKKKVSIKGEHGLPVLAFALCKEWKFWLEQNHAISKGVWMRFYKKGSGIATITYDEALDDALCYGWIDGKVKTYDKYSYIQKFTPRRAQSIW